MYYTGIHPMTGKQVYVTTDYREKQLQRALLQFSRPENANLVREALTLAGREDLIGYEPDCLVRPARASTTEYRPRKGEKGKGKGSDRPRSGERRANGQKADGGRSGSFGSSRSYEGTAPKKNVRKNSKAGFYQPIVESKAPKKSKLERIFGEEALNIRREAARMSESASPKSGKGKKGGKGGKRK
jgi:hypothetical protein